MSLRIKGPGLVRPGFAYIDVNVPVCLVAGVHSAKKRNHSNLARDHRYAGNSCRNLCAIRGVDDSITQKGLSTSRSGRTGGNRESFNKCAFVGTPRRGRPSLHPAIRAEGSGVLDGCLRLPRVQRQQIREVLRSHSFDRGLRSWSPR